MTMTNAGASAEGPAARRIWLAAVVVAGLQTIVLAYMVGERAWVLRSGQEVLLQSAPVDPRDLLRGDYVTLNYDISRVPVATLVGGAPAQDMQNQTLSVRLARQGDGFWTIAESSFGALEPKPDTVVLKTLPFDYQASEFHPPPSVDDPGKDSSPAAGFIRVEYGIERYYVPEGEGRDVESARNSGRVSVAVRISSSGVPQIRALLIDGKPVYEQPLY